MKFRTAVEQRKGGPSMSGLFLSNLPKYDADYDAPQNTSNVAHWYSKFCTYAPVEHLIMSNTSSILPVALCLSPSTPAVSHVEASGGMKHARCSASYLGVSTHKQVHVRVGIHGPRGRQNKVCSADCHSASERKVTPRSRY